jgi:hypothetical protein
MAARSERKNPEVLKVVSRSEVGLSSNKVPEEEQ